ncbi:MAG TPA: urease accessory protein UreE [Terriglobales bacterium]|nr:urease accessory protein UreE [Terriglobales bacterium]
MLELTEKLDGPGASDDSVTLAFDQRQKTRQRLRLDSGREAALILPPGTSIAQGDRLRSQDGVIVVVRAAEEAVSIARSDDALGLARACYHLGNRHVALQVGAGWLRYQRDHVLDEMVRLLGLEVAHEIATFEPERGAYHSHPSGEHHHQ